jgi:hypothetical protein
MVNVVFVAPFLLPTTIRFVAEVARTEGARVALVSQDPVEKLPPAVRRDLGAHVVVRDALDPEELARVVDEAQRRVGTVHRLVGALEDLQEPLARVRERFDIPGMGVEVAKNFRDKSRMKTVLAQAGIPCARHAVARTADEARRVVGDIGLPVVVKPPEGSGARHTYRVNTASQLEEVLSTTPPSPEAPLLVEEFMSGEEHSFDAVSIDGRPVWWSISRYHPSALEVMRERWIQWCVVLPREIDGPDFAPIREAGTASLRALGVGTALTHMEWFRRPDGSVAISEVAARPPGAQFTTLMSYAHDLDFYRAWARLMVHGAFDPPERRWAVGIVFLRGQGPGERVAAISGIDRATRDVGGLVVEAKLPRAGQRGSSHYEGDGYVIVRHPETATVEAALRHLLATVRVELGPDPERGGVR